MYDNSDEAFSSYEPRSHGGKSYTLDEQLERSITWSSQHVLKKKQWLVRDRECDTNAEVPNPFYPELKDLAQIVRLKLLPIRQQLQDIWNDSNEERGSVRGISKLVSAVVEHAAIDFYRGRNLRAPEVLAASLDEPFSETSDDLEDEQREGTLADRIPDEEVYPQAFSSAHLRDTLTDEEYTILYETTVNEAKQKELAQETGKSDSAISRVKARAEEKAAKWLA